MAVGAIIDEPIDDTVVAALEDDESDLLDATLDAADFAEGLRAASEEDADEDADEVNGEGDGEVERGAEVEDDDALDATSDSTVVLDEAQLREARAVRRAER